MSAAVVEAQLTSTTVNRLRSLRNGFAQGVARWRTPQRRVVAAVCYRIDDAGRVEFLLVRTRSGRWTFPKGGIDGDATAAAAAAREAYEEAGALGRVEAASFTRYQHSKGGAPHPVHAHLCRVLHVDEPAESYRRPCWFSAERAKERLRSRRPRPYADELAEVVDRALRRLSAPLAGGK